MKDASSKKPRRRRVWRIARAAVVAILSVYVLYLVAMNVFLSTSLFPRVVNQDPVTIDIQFSRGWSILPGRIHARDLSIRASDSNVEWLLKLDEVTFDVKFLPLFRHRFEVTKARGHGISMVARRKLDAAPFTVEEIADLPPIEGYPAFSVKPSGPPHPERWDDSQYHLWTGRLEDVVAEDVRELWIDKIHFEGSARISGRFYLKPIREVEVGPAHVDVHHGRAGIGRRPPIAEELAGTVDLRIDRFDPRRIIGEIPDHSILRVLTLGTELHARIADVSTLPIVDPPLPFYVAGSFDAPRIALRIACGRITNGTRIDLASRRDPDHDVTVSKQNTIGTASSVAMIVEVANDQLLAHAEARDLALVRADGRGIVSARVAHMEGDARALDLAANEPLQDAHAILDAPNVVLPDASVLNTYIPEATPLAILSGAAHTQARVEAWRADERLSGSGELHADSMDVRLAKMRVRGAFDIAGSFGAFRWNQNEPRLEDAKVGATVTRVALSSDLTPDNTATTAENIVLDATAARVNLDDPLENLDASIRMLDANIIDRMLLRQYLPKGSKMRLACEHAHISAEGHITIDKHLARGQVKARSKELAMTLGDMQIASAVEANARVHDWHWERGDLAIDHASLDVSNLAMTKNAKNARSATENLASIRKLHVSAKSPAFAFSDPLARVELTAKIEGGKVKDAAAVNAFLPDAAVYGLAVEDGTFEGEARLAIVEHIAVGRASASAARMGIRTKPITVVGELSAVANIERWDMEGDRLALGSDSRVTITDVRGHVGAKGERELGAKKIELAGRAADLDMASPTLRGVDGRFVLQDAELPDARALSELLPPGEALRIKSGNAHASGEVEISASTRTASGEIAVEVVKAAVMFHETELSGDFGIRVPVRDFDPDTSSINISGTRIAMRDVEVRNAAAETSRWTGDLWLEDMTASAGRGGPRLDGMLRLEADNARPVLGVLLRGSLPKFIVGLIDMPRLAIRARLHFAPSALLVSDIYGRGGDIALRGSYGLFADEPSGAFVVSKGPLAMGIRLGRDGAHPRFFGLDGWIKTEDANVKAKAKNAESKKQEQKEELEQQKKAVKPRSQ